jgi:hypothetical protein
MLSVTGQAKCYNQILGTAGPDIIESREYYRIIADVLSVDCQIQEIAVDAYYAEHPERASFLCHRIYDLEKLATSGAYVPDTPIEAGLRAHVESLIG